MKTFFVAALIAAFGFSAASASVNIVNDGRLQPSELRYNDPDTLFRDIAAHPEWFGLDDASLAKADETALTLKEQWEYHYVQSSGKFTGPAFNGGNISTVGCAGSRNQNCLNKPSCQCIKNAGPLPVGGYRLSSMITYKDYPYSYALTQTSGDACGRNAFLIHGGKCSSGSWSLGCIVIPDESQRYKIKGGGHLTVVSY